MKNRKGRRIPVAWQISREKKSPRYTQGCAAAHGANGNWQIQYCIAYKRYPSVQKFCTDAGYRGTFVSGLKEQLDLDVDISEKIKPHQMGGWSHPLLAQPFQASQQTLGDFRPFRWGYGQNFSLPHATQTLKNTASKIINIIATTSSE